MKYLGEEKQVEVKTKSVRNVEYMRCDKCNKKITPYNSSRSMESSYVRVHTWHNDWGNDSVESHEYKDLCHKCASEFVAEYVSNMNGSEELKLENKFLYNNETYDGYSGRFFDYENGYNLSAKDYNKE